MKSTIVFIRHAHRDTSDKNRDNGLTDKGRRQVDELVGLFRSGKLPPAKTFWTSPKLRCQETLEPLAKASKTAAVIENLLDERHDDEAAIDFAKRLDRLVEKAHKSLTQMGEDGVLYLCSHGDVIPYAMNLFTSHEVDLSKGEAIIITTEDVLRPELRWRIK
jgi:broad specificity phosphatase PhoE